MELEKQYPQHLPYITRAIELAKRGLYTTRPNPRVGCVVVQGDKIVAEGWHEKFGAAHAEVNALKKAGDLARGATLYVSLEPCNHQGKTPACCELLIESGISEVVVAMRDPNPSVEGKGIERLRAAGINVIAPYLQAEAEELNPGFSKRMLHGLPYVMCKMAMSLDGRSAMASGESQWITGPAARADVQRLRARSCAVLTGVGTVLSDNPGLNVRPEEMVETVSSQANQPMEIRQPLRVVVDSKLRTPPQAKIITLPGENLFAVAAPHSQQYERFAGTHVEIKSFEGDHNRVSLHGLIEYLAQQRHCNEVLLEAGPVLCGAMIQAGLVDEIVVYIGPKLLGSDALPLFKIPGLRQMADQITLQIVGLKMLDKDCRLRAKVSIG